MSPILINAGTSNQSSATSSIWANTDDAKLNKKKKKIKDEVKLSQSKPEVVPVVEEKSEEEIERAREERKATGRTIAIVIFLSLMCLALYQVIQRKTTILAGVSLKHLEHVKR